MVKWWKRIVATWEEGRQRVPIWRLARESWKPGCGSTTPCSSTMPHSTQFPSSQLHCIRICIFFLSFSTSDRYTHKLIYSNVFWCQRFLLFPRSYVLRFPYLTMEIRVFIFKPIHWKIVIQWNIDVFES